jgi:hypothetical protein
MIPMSGCARVGTSVVFRVIVANRADAREFSLGRAIDGWGIWVSDHEEGTSVRSAAASPAETFTTARAIAIHVAGHAVMARIISGPFLSTRVVGGPQSYHELEHGLPAWFTHDDTGVALGQVTLAKRLMVCLAGTATEAAWLSGCVDVPPEVTDVFDLGQSQDQLAARKVASAAHRGPAVTDAYIEYQRQVVLTRTGSQFFPRPRPSDFGNRDMLHRRAFWLSVYGVADAVEHGGELSWAKTKSVMDQLKRDAMGSMISNARATTPSPGSRATPRDHG